MKFNYLRNNFIQVKEPKMKLEKWRVHIKSVQGNIYLLKCNLKLNKVREPAWQRLHVYCINIFLNKQFEFNYRRSYYLEERDL